MRPADPTGRRGHIFVAEDDDTVRGFVLRVLRRAGYKVTFASSGSEALALLSSGGAPPDLLLTDVVMPGLTGPRLEERFHRLAVGVPVLYMSGYLTVAEATRRMLESLGHEVRVCKDAQAGIEAYTPEPTAFDLVLMDLSTPRLSASHALARILEVNPQARVVLCSGYDVGAEGQRLQEAGADAFLRKPYRLEQLEAMIARRQSPRN